MTELTDKERAINFLKEYEKLVRKHNLIIDGCGCCDNPWVSNTERHRLKSDKFKDVIEQHVSHLIEVVEKEGI